MPYDFSSVDISRVDRKKLNDHADSLRQAYWADSLVQLRNYITSTEYTSQYSAFVIGIEQFYGSLDYLNAGLRSMGIDELDDSFFGISWGVDNKTNHWLWSYRFAGCIRNKTESDDAIIEARGFAAIDFSVGYALVNARRFQLYPITGIAWQSFEIEVKRKGARQDINDVNSLLGNFATTKLKKDDLTFTYGLEANYHTSYSDAGGGIIIGLRYGQSAELGTGNYKVNGRTASYNSNDKLRQSYLSLVIKFYGKMARGRNY